MPYTDSDDRKQYFREHYQLNKRLKQSYKLQKAYGITIEDYEQMLAEQNGRCALCKRPPGKRAFAVDHDHKTGKVRGLTCTLCNRNTPR